MGFWTVLPRIFCYKFVLYSTRISRFISVVTSFPKFQFLLSLSFHVMFAYFSRCHFTEFSQLCLFRSQQREHDKFSIWIFMSLSISWIYEFFRIFQTSHWTLNAEYHQIKFIFNLELMHFKTKEIVLHCVKAMNRLWKFTCRMIFRME